MKSFTLIVLALLLLLPSGSLRAFEGDDYATETQQWADPGSYDPTVHFETDIGILMTPVGFGTQITAFQYATPYFHFGQSIQYYRNDDDSVASQELHYSADFRMRLAPFIRYIFSPYLAVAVGYNRWLDEQGMVATPRVSYDVGLNIQLARFFSLVLVHQDLGFIDSAPPTYLGKPVYGKSVKSNDVMLSFSLDDTMF